MQDVAKMEFKKEGYLLIGQLGDPNYLRKIPALFYEFEELGANEAFGYRTPGDMRKRYARFYWDVIDDHIQDAL